MSKILRLVLHLGVLAMAYPLVTAFAVILVMIAIRQGVSSAVTIAVLVGAALIGARMTMPRMSRGVAGVRQRWTTFVLERWKRHEERRLAKASEDRIRTSVYDATAERTALRSDDR